MRAQALAPAKVNLFLHVGPPQPDGYHPVCSLMVFADVGDRVTIEPTDQDEFHIEGEFAADLGGTDPGGNLVSRAIDLLRARTGVAAPLRVTLQKALPVAAGLGGGSSDAGAALRAARQALGLSVSDSELSSIMAELGADGPACFAARPVVGEGRGDRLLATPDLPELAAVLVNPRVACPTGPVYRAYDAAGAPGRADRPLMPESFGSAMALAEFLKLCRNDLEPPAIGVAPQIGAVLSLLSSQPETLLARVSGSGATCFALCADPEDAHALATRITGEHPGWWVRACRLGGPWPDLG